MFAKKKEARKSRHFENFHEKKRSGVSVREVTVSRKTYFWPKNRRFFGKTSKLKFLDDEKKCLASDRCLARCSTTPASAPPWPWPRLSGRGESRGIASALSVRFFGQSSPDARPARPARARCCPGPAAGAAYTLRDKIFECARQKF